MAKKQPEKTNKNTKKKEAEKKKKLEEEEIDREEEDSMKSEEERSEKVEQEQFEELEKIKDIGPKVAQDIYNYFHDDYNLKFIEKLEKNGVVIISSTFEKSQKLAGLNLVFTGELNSLTRSEAQEKVRELGGEVSDSISKKTDYLVVGENPGSKFKKAQKMDIKIINETEFLNLLK